MDENNQVNPEEQQEIPMFEDTELPQVILQDSCPYCGSTRGVAKMIKDAEVRKGKWTHTDQPAHVGATQAVVMDPFNLTNLITAPVITILYEVCFDCLRQYPINITSIPDGANVGAMAQAMQQQAKGQMGDIDVNKLFGKG